MTKKSTLLLLAVGFAIPWCITYADQFSAATNYTVCFTPAENCTSEITKAINRAQRSILVQAYTITSYPIEKALIRAKQKGVEVQLIMDKNQLTQVPEPINYLAKQGVPVKLDCDIKGLAHNKVMVIDGQTVITGSFNFTKAAQQSNAENVLIIDDQNLATKYSANWQQRFKHSCDLKR